MRLTGMAAMGLMLATALATGLAATPALAANDADAHDLGSRDNPVRVNMPAGERGYLARLRCSDGRKPEFERHGNVGVGVFGNIVDLYELRCPGAEPASAEVYLDMYHPAHSESRPVPGFRLITSKGPPPPPPPAPAPPTAPTQTRLQDPTG